MSAEGISSQVRRIAILVTSLDASAGRQLLMAMPTELARQVRRSMTQLGHVDPDEQRQILAEFRMQAMNSSSSEHSPAANTANAALSRNELHAATPTRSSGQMALGGHVEVERQPEVMHYGSSRNGATLDTAYGEPKQTSFGLEGVSIAALGDLLRGERATVVAVVLSQLQPHRGAELLGKLSKPLQREAIVSFSRIGQIDPDAMAAIHEHLASRIADYHHRQAGENQSTSRMQELLAAAEPDLRSDWQSTLYQAEPHLANRLGIAAPIAATTAQSKPATNSTVNSTVNSPVKPVVSPASSAADVHSTTETNAKQLNSTQLNSPQPGSRQTTARPPAARGASMLDLLADNVVTTADQRINRPLATPAVPKTAAGEHQPSERDDEQDLDQPRILPFPTPAMATASSDRSIRFEQILDLPADEIGQILAAADTDVILYALAGASPAFMKRFMAMLDRADGRALQARLKQLRAINLKDVDAAQRRLCELAASRQLARAAA